MGGGRAGCSGRPIAACSWLVRTLGVVPARSSASLPAQYFSTLENSIVSLFVLLTTAK